MTVRLSLTVSDADSEGDEESVSVRSSVTEMVRVLSGVVDFDREYDAVTVRELDTSRVLLDVKVGLSLLLTDTVIVRVGETVMLLLRDTSSVTVGVFTGVRIFVSDGVGVSLTLGSSCVMVCDALWSRVTVFVNVREDVIDAEPVFEVGNVSLVESVRDGERDFSSESVTELDSDGDVVPEELYEGLRENVGLMEPDRDSDASLDIETVSVVVGSSESVIEGDSVFSSVRESVGLGLWLGVLVLDDVGDFELDTVNVSESSSVIV